MTGEAASPSAYAHPERERRFLLAEAPATAEVLVARRITDRYLTGTRLRLRRSEGTDGADPALKLTQKVPSGTAGPVRGWITTTYLSPAEYALIAVLPATTITKTRLSVPPLGIDVFEGQLAGLITAEAEFASDQECEAFTPPSRCLHEVTTDARFTGGRLAQASRGELVAWLGGFGLAPGGGQ